MDNMDILKQLINGNHLEKNELIKAQKIILLLEQEINERLKHF
tara:strand:+ start:234 stop:362 length:129 start_codon:yes stop_codon:yes gene_type:complete